MLSGVVFQTQPIVQGQDQNGARDLHFQDQVSLTAATGTLAGTTTVQAQNGIATFSDIAYTATADQESFRLVADDQAISSQAKSSPPNPSSKRKTPPGNGTSILPARPTLNWPPVA